MMTNDKMDTDSGPVFGTEPSPALSSTSLRGFNPSGYTICLALSTFLVVAFSIYAANKQMEWYSTSVFDIDYGFGPVIRALVQQHRFGSVDTNFGWWTYAARMPVIPLLGFVSFHLSPTASVFMLLKNFLLWPLWMVALYRLKKHYKISDKWALIVPCSLLLSPFNLSIAGQVNVEEGFIFAMLALLFSLLLTMEGLLGAVTAGLLLGAMYLTKSSMLFVCMVGALWALIRCWRVNRVFALIPLVGVLMAVVGWGSYIKSVSGVFAVGANASSWNGWNFYKGNNPYAYALYPGVNLDSLDHLEAGSPLLPSVSVHNEWELNKAQLKMGETYVREHPLAVLRMDLRKLGVALWDLEEAPAVVVGRMRQSVILSNVTNHLLLAGVLLIVIVNATRGKVGDFEILAVTLTVAFLLPYFGGFLYSRHLVPVYGMMGVTLAMQLAQWSTPAKLKY